MPYDSAPEDPKGPKPTPPTAKKNMQRRWLESQLVEIRERAVRGESYASISRDYEVGQSTIRDIATGLTHKEAPGPLVKPKHVRRSHLATPFGPNFAETVDFLVNEAIEQRIAAGELIRNPRPLGDTVYVRGRPDVPLTNLGASGKDTLVLRMDKTSMDLVHLPTYLLVSADEEEPK